MTLNILFLLLIILKLMVKRRGWTQCWNNIFVVSSMKDKTIGLIFYHSLNFHIIIQYNNQLIKTPFFENYGFNPKGHPEIPFNERPSRAEKRVTEINENINLLKENLNKAKETYKKYADQIRLDPPRFEVGIRFSYVRNLV